MDDGLAGLFYVLSVIVSVLPTIAYVLLVWRIDRYEKEPIRLLVTAFFWGAVPAVILASGLEAVFDEPLAALSGGYAEVFSSSLVAPPVEELFKGLALWVVYRLARAEFDGALDGIIYGSLIGFGFAMTENVFYFWSAQSEGDLGHWAMIVLGRAVAFGFNHAMFTSFTGIGFGISRYIHSRAARFVVNLTGLAAAIVVHGLHNLLASSELCMVSLVMDWGGVAVVFVIVLLAWQRERAWMQQYLADEVREGLLTPAEFEMIASRGQRYRHAIKTLGTSGVRRARLWRALTSTATELAFKKRQLAVMGEERGNSVRVAHLRERLTGLRQELAAYQNPVS